MKGCVAIPSFRCAAVAKRGSSIKLLRDPRVTLRARNTIQLLLSEASLVTADEHMQSIDVLQCYEALAPAEYHLPYGSGVSELVALLWQWRWRLTLLW